MFTKVKPSLALSNHWTIGSSCSSNYFNTEIILQGFRRQLHFSAFYCKYCAKCQQNYVRNAFRSKIFHMTLGDFFSVFPTNFGTSASKLERISYEIAALLEDQMEHFFLICSTQCSLLTKFQFACACVCLFCVNASLSAYLAKLQRASMHHLIRVLNLKILTVIYTFLFTRHYKIYALKHYVILANLSAFHCISSNMVQ